MNISKKIAVFCLFFAVGTIFALSNFANYAMAETEGEEILVPTSTTAVSAPAYISGVEDIPGGTSDELAGDFNDVIFSVVGSDQINMISSSGVLNPLAADLVNESGTIYWGNHSMDGVKMNVGFCVFGNGNCPLPGVPFSDLEYFASPSGAAEHSVTFDTAGSVTVTLLKKISAYSNADTLGWYDPANPSDKHIIFDGSAAAGAVATFTPSPLFVFYLDNGHGSVFSSKDSDNTGEVSTHQQFAFFGYVPITPTSTPTSTIPLADLSIQKTADATSTFEGSETHYTITLSALGPATSTGVVATDTLPIGLTFVNATSSHGSYASSTGTWTVGDMPASSTATLTIAATVNTGTAGQTITNTAVAGEDSSLVDDNPANNSSTVSIFIAAKPIVAPTSTDLMALKTVDISNPHEGDTIHYTITLSTLGPATSTYIVVTDALPAGLTFVNATTSQGDYASSTGTWAVGDMPASSTATLVIVAEVNAGTSGQTIVNTAVASEDNSLVDNNPTNNSSSIAIVVRPIPTATSTDLTVLKTVDSANPHEGDTVHYTITLSALGPATSTGVVATDTLPIGLTFVNATSSHGSYASSTGTWTVGDMPASSTATLTIAATVNTGTAGQTITNTAVAGESTSGTDLDTSNNSSTVSFAVFIPGPAPCTTNCGGGGNIGVVGGGGGGASYTLVIDNNATSTLTTSSTLSIYATGAQTMQISNYPDFASSTPWIPYAIEMPWTLTDGAGTKTVYGRFRGYADNYIGAAQDSIELLGGQVLGAVTSCGVYLNDYIHMGWNNNPDEVRKLQTFLNGNLGTTLAISGVYDQESFDAVKRFQVKYNSKVLAPWVPLGLPNDMTPTGFVYQTTKWWINELQCEALNLSMPALQVYRQ